jgi:hypothetical protein
VSIDLAFRPTSSEELAQCLGDPMWRLCSGALYNIMLKSEVPGQGMVVPFKPNKAQMRFIKRMWHRNIILKARQLGYTTLIAIMWLDHALFNADQRCGILAQDRESVEVIFRDKVRLAYDRLPAELRAAMPLARDSAAELLFAHNNSSVRVATSLRSGTIHRLHISEFGKICAEFPKKATEVVTGSLPTVPTDGVVIIESTAEGRDGAFFKMTNAARALFEEKKQLSAADYRFHFSPWFDEAEYRIADESIVLSEKDHLYFDEVEVEMGVRIDLDQRRWYVSKKTSDFSGEDESMWQQFPSTPDEAFKVSAQGTYYAVQLAAARKQGRIGIVRHDPRYPVNTFWDIGGTDGTGIWLHQLIGTQHRFIGFIEGWSEPYEYFIRKLQVLEYTWGHHYLPHDADAKRQQGKKVQSAKDELMKLGLGGKWEIVPAPETLIQGVNQTRTAFSLIWIDAEGCKEGIQHLEGYRKTWNDKGGYWQDNVPNKANGHSEAADALRQFGQSVERVERAVARGVGGRRPKGWKYPATPGGSWQGA